MIKKYFYFHFLKSFNFFIIQTTSPPIIPEIFFCYVQRPMLNSTFRDLSFNTLCLKPN